VAAAAFTASGFILKLLWNTGVLVQADQEHDPIDETPRCPYCSIIHRHSA
jgi:hypothetical protein